MKTLVNNTDLAKWRNKAAKFDALEIGGVDNWQWYEESLKNHEDIGEITNDSKVKEYHNNQRLFFQNNPCDFISYLDENYAMIKLYAGFDVDIEGSSFCTACQIGGGSNIPVMSHNCDDAMEIIESVLEEIDENRGSIIVPVLLKDLYEEPVIMINHKALSGELVKGRTEYKKQTMEIKSKIIDLESELSRLEKQIELKKTELDKL